MKRKDYINFIVNNDIIKHDLAVGDEGLFALAENMLYLARIATTDSDLGKEKEKMSSFIVEKTLNFLEEKGMSSDKAYEIVTKLAIGIVIEDHTMS